MLPRFVLLLAIGTLLAPASAQQRTKMNMDLMRFLQGDHGPDARVDLFIRGDVPGMERAVAAAGGHVKQAMRGLVNARVPVASVHALAADPSVVSFEFSLEQGNALNDSMRFYSKVQLVHDGMAPLPMPYDGEGVLIGVIDRGLEKNHPDFKNADGSTRIMKFWDQTRPFNAQLTPEAFGYGQAWDSTAINAGQMPAGDQPGSFGHGSWVTGIAAGNGLAIGRHQGVAPKADIIVVSNGANLPNWRASVADGVAYILGEAEALGRPVVINISMGAYRGSHDGLDAAAMLIDSMITAQPGRALVCAAGNSNQFPPYHLRHDLSGQQRFTWFRNNPQFAGMGGVYFSAWADMDDISGVQFRVGADRTNPSLQFRGATPFRNVAQCLGEVLRDSLWSTSGNLLGVVDYLATQRGGQVELEVLLLQPDSNTYNFRFITNGTGRLDIWSHSVHGTSDMVTAIPTVEVYPDIAGYVLPDNDQHMVDSWACLDNVATVANHHNALSYIDYNGNLQVLAGVVGDIAPSSSKGPTRDGRLKPDMAATGDLTMSAGALSTINNMIITEPFKIAQGGFHLRGGGTSGASPVVAGTAALYLQKCPNASVQEILDALFVTARADAFTGDLPNNLWGRGKIDAFEALVTSNFPFPGSLGSSAVECATDGVALSGPDGFSAYHWSTGEDAQNILVMEEGQVSLAVANASGCRAYSDTISVLLLEPPAVPFIEQDGDLLTGTPAFAYQWFFNGLAIPGATAQELLIVGNGDYTLQVFDADGCSSFSDPYNVTGVGMADAAAHAMHLWPSPASHELFLQPGTGVAGAVTVRIFDLGGRQVFRHDGPLPEPFRISLEGMASGSYMLYLEHGTGVATGHFMKVH